MASKMDPINPTTKNVFTLANVTGDVLKRNSVTEINTPETATANPLSTMSTNTYLRSAGAELRCALELSHGDPSCNSN